MGPVNCTATKARIIPLVSSLLTAQELLTYAARDMCLCCRVGCCVLDAGLTSGTLDVISTAYVRKHFGGPLSLRLRPSSAELLASTHFACETDCVPQHPIHLSLWNSSVDMTSFHFCSPV